MKKFLLFFSAITAVVLSFATGHVDIVAAGLSTAYFFPTALTAEQYRMFYKKLKLVCEDAGFIVAPGDLRSEVAISNTQSSYQFPMRDITMNKTTFPLSQGVKDNDLFISAGLGMFWDSRTAGQAIVKLQSYPNPAAAVAAGITTNQLYAFYNGQLSVQVGSTQFIQQLSSQTFLTIPPAQQSNVSTDDTQWDLAAAIKHIGAYPIFSGKDDDKVILNIPTLSGVSDVVGDGQAVLTLWSKGVVVNNGANQPQLYKAILEILKQL